MDRAEFDGYADYRADLHACGHPMELTLSKRVDLAWRVEEAVCAACAATEVVRRQVTQAHEKDKPLKNRPLHMDGRFFYAVPHEL